MNNKNLGPLMIDVNGFELTVEDMEILDHPAVCGVIIFARNYHDYDQINHLNKQIKNLKNKNKSNNNQLIISVDQEGGTVQRIRSPLTELPNMVELGKYYDYDNECALDLTRKIGWLLAKELLTLGFDFSFTPVVDLNLCDNKIIKLRAFHKKPHIVSKLASALRSGLNSAGMPAVAKHFPGHGGVLEDSHERTPSDIRSFADLQKKDLIPFGHLISENIEAIMTSHILFPNIDNNIISFSKFWLQDILREKLNYRGLIVSDDLNMSGADFIINDTSGEKLTLNHNERVRGALDAGCELILLCNNRKAVENTLDIWSSYGWQETKDFSTKLNTMRARNNNPCSLQELKKSNQWQEVIKDLDKIKLLV